MSTHSPLNVDSSHQNSGFLAVPTLDQVDNQVFKNEAEVMPLRRSKSVTKAEEITIGAEKLRKLQPDKP